MKSFLPKFVQRLYIKKSYLEKAVNLEFTESGIVQSVMFSYYDTQRNLDIARACLNLYKYDEDTLNSFISKLEVTLKEHIEWKKRRDKIKLYLSQGGLGNWAGKKWDLENMIKLLKNSK